MTRGGRRGKASWRTINLAAVSPPTRSYCCTASHAEQFVIRRKLFKAFVEAPATLHVGPANDPRPVDEELGRELNLVLLHLGQVLVLSDAIQLIKRVLALSGGHTETRFPGQAIALIEDRPHRIVIHSHARNAERPVTRQFWIGTDEIPRRAVAKVQTRAVDWRGDDTYSLNPHFTELLRARTERHDVSPTERSVKAAEQGEQNRASTMIVGERDWAFPGDAHHSELRSLISRL